MENGKIETQQLLLGEVVADRRAGVVQALAQDAVDGAYQLPGVRVQLVREGSAVELVEIDGSTKLAEIVQAFIGGADREHFVSVLLNVRRHAIGINTVSIGTVSASLVHPREVFKPALLAGASAVVLAHNHPSDDVTPSTEDKDATRRLVRAGELLGVPVLDHVIVGVTPGKHFSFKDRGLL